VSTRPYPRSCGQCIGSHNNQGVVVFGWWACQLPGKEDLALLQHTSVQAVWFASTQAVPGTACGAPPVM
jgi:hypothetical protein